MELVRGKNSFKFLVFDALVHLGRSICELPLRTRLECVEKFLRCNEMLGVSPCHRIEVQLKDFFRLVNRKFNVIEFMLSKYAQMMLHEYDGLLFNHEAKKYVLGTTNEGYVKWKPESLNTVDFMVVPNANLQDKYGKKVLDLYVAVHDPELGRYTRQFYGFTVIKEIDYDSIAEKLEEREYQRFKAQEAVEEDYTGSVIADCRFDQTKGIDERTTLAQLGKEPAEELPSNLMKQGVEERDGRILEDWKKKIYDKNWHIYKIREDKQLPKNVEVVKKIEKPIRDGISEDDLVKRGEKIREEVFGRNH